jgi:hypothetical protein
MALVRVVAVKDFLATALSTTAVGTAVSTVAPSAGEAVYGGLHLTGIGTATTARLAVFTIQSASSSGFTAATTEIAFSLSTGRGSTMTRLTSPSTDRPWRRASWTMSTTASTAGAWNGVVWVGIR